MESVEKRIKFVLHCKHKQSIKFSFYWFRGSLSGTVVSVSAHIKWSRSIIWAANLWKVAPLSLLIKAHDQKLLVLLHLTIIGFSRG